MAAPQPVPVRGAPDRLYGERAVWRGAKKPDSGPVQGSPWLGPLPARAGKLRPREQETAVCWHKQLTGELPQASSSMSTPESFTAQVAQRPGRVAARQWTIDPSCAEPLAEPAAVAAKIMAGLSDVTSKQRAMVEPYLQAYTDMMVFKTAIQQQLGFLPDAEWIAEVAATLENQEYTDKLARRVGLDGRPALRDPKSDTVRENKVKTGSASGTAVAAAYLKHMCTVYLGAPDTFASKMVPSMSHMASPAAAINYFKSTGNLPAAIAKEGEESKLKGPGVIQCHVTMMHGRTSFIDDAIVAFLEAHARDAPCNVVVLGAGFDTRPYRMPEVWKLAQVRFFEIDSPATQDAKLAGLDAVDPPLPNRDSVTFVPVDFTGGERWSDKAIDKGLDPALPTMIVWEGVTYYLPESAVAETLAIVRSDFRGPAAIAFDFFSPQTVAVFGPGAASAGEPMLFGATGDKIAELAGAAGLDVLDLLSWAQMQERCMPRKDGKPVGKAGDFKGLALLGHA